MRGRTFQVFSSECIQKSLEVSLEGKNIAYRLGSVKIVVHSFKKQCTERLRLFIQLLILLFQDLAGILGALAANGPLLHCLKCAIEALKPTFGFRHSLVRKIYGASVMFADDEQSQRFRVHILQHVSYGKKVSERLGHLLVIYIDEAVVYPIAHERRIKSHFALRDLVFVMWKDQVLP